MDEDAEVLMLSVEFFEVVSKRYSVRKFKKKNVEEEKLNRILETANLAPSAGNLQALEAVVIKDGAIKKKGNCNPTAP
ncbi:MAG: nitroreductase family protein [Candidatus Aenigmarchaeota archaeon]|nr:nitroreductase family protein [Candidatus Aenigmarchaeota archaeon]MDI6722874.1 nitroreductase family protein [Candidatus Aenigmarchaeota archaeon]